MAPSTTLPNIHERESIHRFIRARLKTDGSLPDPVMALPDAAAPDPSSVSFMAGAKDGAFGHHFGSGHDEKQASQLAQQIAKTAAKPTKRRLRKLYDGLSDDEVLGYIDPMIERLVELSPSTADVAEIGAWLAAQSPDRGPVKAGIALLGITGPANGPLIHELGAHEEFTLFAAVAFSNSRSNPEADIFALAKAVKGWGRIHCVEQLKETQDPEIQDWILRDGYRNDVMYEYLAYIAATTGGLTSALDRPSPDRQLLTAAGEILEALLLGGPAENIDDYDEAPMALGQYLAHMTYEAASIDDLLAVAEIRGFLTLDRKWDDRLARGWTEEARQDLVAKASVIIEQPSWRTIVEQELASEDPGVFFRADQAARLLGIDTFDRHLELITDNPLEGNWFHAWQLADEDRAETLVEMVSRLLDLEVIASGPSTATGMGVGFEHHLALGWTLQALVDYPSVGGDLVSIGLQSPSIQNRQ